MEQMQLSLLNLLHYQLLFVSLAVRFTLILYSNIHDYVFHVNFTDIDYSVYSDAARHVAAGESPFNRVTYRYTPALAWILLPNNRYKDFGKYLFCVFDVVVAWMHFEIMGTKPRKQAREANRPSSLRSREDTEDQSDDDFTRAVVVFWLANPLTAVISARGNADVLVCAAVLFTLYLLKKEHISIGSFASVVLFFYWIYGEVFLEEFLLYHIKRRDIRHNFSVYFYLLYLIDEEERISKLVGFLAFLPQLFLVVYFSFRYHDDLPFCWFLITFAFVTYNKVCTSQYFVWYIVFLPLIVDRVKISLKELVSLITVWLASQGLWLLFAYFFEFQGWHTFECMWAASLVFLLVNAHIMARLICTYSPPSRLGDVEDITVKGLNVVRKCKRVYLEAYTSILCYGLDKSRLEEYYGRELIEADRIVIEQNSDEILAGADVDDVAVLVVGDPFGATTHTDLVLRAKQKALPVKVIHNASILNAVGCCGLQLYNFGETVSIVMWLDGWEPDSYYDKIASNMEKGFHTLCLLDIKTKEQSIENMMSILIYTTRALNSSVYNESSPCVGLARVGWDDQKIVFCSLKEMSQYDLGPPLHCMILPGQMHPLEVDMLNTFKPGTV
uniref:GPI alpha-1,4-mannosyltransferase I, catalytic subunit n=1 Tax=Angiostrongylus cantonensis TaxID=6313 RepID=A0A0K0DGL2_ANGCA